MFYQKTQVQHHRWYNITDGTTSQIDQQQDTTLAHTQATQHYPAGQIRNTNTQQSLQYVSLPYVQGLSEKLSDILKPFNIKTVSRNTNNLSRIFKITKDTIPKLETVNVVYNIPCADCTASYIGTTKRLLETRILEQKKDVYNPPDKWQCTALTKHAWHQDHTFDFDNVQIVDRSDNYRKQMILEMTHIASNPNVIKERTDTDNSSVVYHLLLNNRFKEK